MAHVDAFYLPVGQGERFCLLHSPAEGIATRGAMLFVHPFAEEMNKSRRMAAVQARALADAGWAVLQIDLLGCGDSSGDFADGTWQFWIGDSVEAAKWLKARSGHQPVLWGLRAGCLLLPAVARQMEASVELLLWHPVTSGKQYLQQFLRLKVASLIGADNTNQRIGTRELRELLAHGTSVEIAGYTVSSALALGLEGAELDLPENVSRVGWIEISATPGGELSPGSRARIEEWRARGFQAEATAIHGQRFWQTVEITECPELVDATLRLLQRWRA